MGRSARSSIIRSTIFSTGTSISRASNSFDNANMDSKGSSITKSRSCVVRGSPHAHTATAPPIKYGMLAAERASKTMLTKALKVRSESDVKIATPNRSQCICLAQFGMAFAQSIGGDSLGQLDHGYGHLHALRWRQPPRDCHLLGINLGQSAGDQLLFMKG